MKSIIQYLIGLLLVGYPALEQDEIQKLTQGEWSLHPNYESADVWIFRTDGIYLVYNELYFQITHRAAADVMFDNDMATALTEKGCWSYNKQKKIITLQERYFLLEETDFTQAYGKNDPLHFKIKNLSNHELVLCTTKDNHYFATYLKNFVSIQNDARTFYKEVTQAYTGSGDKTFTLALSGYETELRLKKAFCEGPIVLYLENKKQQAILTTNFEIVQQKQELLVPLRGVTQLNVRVATEHTNQKWQFELEIK